MTGHALTDMQQKIIAATRRLLDDRSIGELRMRDIAGSCNLSAASVYGHFKNKGSLLRALWEVEAAELAGRYEKALQTASTGIDGMVAFGYAVFSDFVGYARNRARVVEFLTYSRSSEEAKSSLAQGHHQLVALLMESLQRTFPRIPLRRAKMLAELTLAITAGIALAHLYGGNSADPDDIFGQWLELLELSAGYLEE